MIYEAMARAHATALDAGRHRRATARPGHRRVRRPDPAHRGVLAGVVKASSGFSDDGVAKAVVGKLKEAIADVGGGQVGGVSPVSARVPARRPAPRPAPSGLRCRRGRDRVAARRSGPAPRPPPAAAPRPRARRAVADEAVRRRPVAVFDSGVGGLTVLHELLVQLPHEDFVYLADSARFPFGKRSPAELEAFSLQIAEALLARGAKLLVVACNSATAAALPALRARMMETHARRRRPRRGPAGRRAGRGGHPHRPRRADGHARDRGERRLRARRLPRSTRSSSSRPSPARTSPRSSRAASRSTSASSTPCARTARRCAKRGSTR